MSDQGTPPRPFFQPRPEFDDLQTAYLLRKLAEKVVVQPNGCWVWTGAKNKKGYGHFNIGGRGQQQTKMVHRTIFQLCVGDTPNKMMVCHDCPDGDNPACCNPEHLWLGHHQQNMDDMMGKGRHRTDNPKGAEHPNAAFTDDEVREIRRRVAAGEKGAIAQIAREKGVLTNTIWRLVHRKTYASVPDDECPGHGRRGIAEKCCDRAGEYNGFGSDGPRLFTCPKGCSCHD